jgi:hypothetical protein
MDPPQPWHHPRRHRAGAIGHRAERERGSRSAGRAGHPGATSIQGSQGVQGPAGATGKAGTVAPAPKVTTAPKPAPAAEFGEGIYKVGTDISPGTYKGTVQDGNGYWARLSSSDTSNILANDLKEKGTMYLTVRSSDKYIEISGVTFTKVS